MLYLTLLASSSWSSLSLSTSLHTVNTCSLSKLHKNYKQKLVYTFTLLPANADRSSIHSRSVKKLSMKVKHILKTNQQVFTFLKKLFYFTVQFEILVFLPVPIANQILWAQDEARQHGYTLVSTVSICVL